MKNRIKELQAQAKFDDLHDVQNNKHYKVVALTALQMLKDSNISGKETSFSGFDYKDGLLFTGRQERSRSKSPLSCIVDTENSCGALLQVTIGSELKTTVVLRPAALELPVLKI